MEFRQQIVQILFVLLVTTHTVYSLKCYVCNSAKQDGCANKTVAQEFLQECGHDHVSTVFCRKSSYHVPEQANGKNDLPATLRVVRSCGWMREASNNTCDWGGDGDLQIEQCTCSSDGCNAGGLVESLRFHTVSLIALMTSAYIFSLC